MVLDACPSNGFPFHDKLRKRMVFNSEKKNLDLSLRQIGLQKTKTAAIFLQRENS